MIEVSGGGKDCTSHKRGILSRARISASDREHSEIITELLPTTVYVPLACCIFSLVLSKRMLLTEEVDCRREGALLPASDLISIGVPKYLSSPSCGRVLKYRVKYQALPFLFCPPRDLFLSPRSWFCRVSERDTT